MLGWGGPAPTRTIPYCWIAATTQESAILKCLQDPSRHAGGTLEFLKCLRDAQGHLGGMLGWGGLAHTPTIVLPSHSAATTRRFAILKCLQDPSRHAGGSLEFF